jgi:acetyl esterase/lipase
VGSLIPIVSLVREANQHGAVISWGEHLRASAPGARAVPNRTELYATVENKALYADIYFPVPPSDSPVMTIGERGASGPRSTPVLMIHGGGYSSGHRSDGRDWDRWLAERGYTVFDVDYRLGPPPTWKDAADDAACALGWVAAHASDYHIAPDHLIVAGQSAGGGLALQVAYAVQDGTFTSSCGGTPPQPRAVVAFYPPDDFALGWRLDTKIGPIGARALNTQYIGGSPEQYPERYRAVSAVYHVREGLPPTFVVAGARDHLVPWEGHKELADDLNLAGVSNILLTIPYSDHAFDMVWGSLGGQITRRALVEFLTRYSGPANP